MPLQAIPEPWWPPPVTVLLRRTEEHAEATMALNLFTESKMQMSSIESGVLSSISRLQESVASTQKVLTISREICIEQIMVIALRQTNVENGRRLLRPEITNLASSRDGVDSKCIHPVLYQSAESFMA